MKVHYPKLYNMAHLLALNLLLLPKDLTIIFIYPFYFPHIEVTTNPHQKLLNCKLLAIFIKSAKEVECTLFASQYYRVIALISVNIVPSWDIEGRELASVRRYPNEGQYSSISARYNPFMI